MTNTGVEIIDISDLAIDKSYVVRQYKHIYGSYGLAFVVKAVSEDDVAIYLRVVEGNLYDYLLEKKDSYTFIILKENSELGESHIVIDDRGKWINLSPK